VHAKPGQAVVPDVTYPAEGINVSAAAPSSPGPLAPAASSPAAVLSSLESQPVPQAVLGSALSAQTPAIDLRTVTELHPVSVRVPAGTPFTAWVVTYTNTSSQVLGPGNATSVSGCTSVAVMVASTGAWADFFQECGTVAACVAEVNNYGYSAEAARNICAFGRARSWYHGVITNKGSGAYPSCEARAFDSHGKVVFSGQLAFMFAGRARGARCGQPGVVLQRL
jgi:hypothetical protein